MRFNGSNRHFFGLIVDDICGDIIEEAVGGIRTNPDDEDIHSPGVVTDD